MMTIDVIYNGRAKNQGFVTDDIYVDIDDSGWAYLKQSAGEDGEQWISLPVQQVPALIEALQKIRV